MAPSGYGLVMGSVPAEMDLNLLRVFDAVMDTGSVSEAAARLHLSVPATSRALGRLRRAMGDPILVRAGRGLTPTPFAQRTAGRVKQLLENAADLLDDSADDCPERWRRTFTVRVNDGLAPVLVPRLLTRMAIDTPLMGMRVLTDDSDHTDELCCGTIDLDIGVSAEPAPDVRVQPLYADGSCAVVASSSTLGRAANLTPDRLCAYPHVTTARGRADRLLTEALREAGRARRVIAEVPSYAISVLLALEDDVIAIVPRLLATHLRDQGLAIRVHDVPLALPELTVELRWHQRLDTDPPTQWLRQAIANALPRADSELRLTQP